MQQWMWPLWLVLCKRPSWYRGDRTVTISSVELILSVPAIQLIGKGFIVFSAGAWEGEGEENVSRMQKENGSFLELWAGLLVREGAAGIQMYLSMQNFFSWVAGFCIVNDFHLWLLKMRITVSCSLLDKLKIYSKEDSLLHYSHFQRWALSVDTVVFS